MTKEEKLELELYQAYDDGNFKSVLDEFFEANVCIPKGVNRHPYADVFHSYAEGIPCEMKGNDSNTWLALLFSDFFEYRIKPSEPVHEYVWYTDKGETSWMTDEEADILEEYWYRANETKRVRQ